MKTSDFFRWLSPTAPRNVIGFGDIYTTMPLFLPLDTLCVCQILFLHLSQAPDSFFLPKILLDYNYSYFPDWIYTRYNFDRFNLSINEENNNIYIKMIMMIMIILILMMTMMTMLMMMTKLISNKN